MKILLRFFAILLIFTASLPVGGYPAFSAELGVGFRVVPTGGKVGGNNQLWFALDRGESGVRQFEVISSSDISQLIQLSFVEAQIVDGQPVAGSDQSKIASWITPDANNFVLNPRESRMIQISTKVPVDAKDGSYKAYLKVSASSAKSTKVKKNVTQAIVKNAISFNQELYVLVGDAKSLNLDFEILDLKDFTDGDGKKHISVSFRNLGKVPLGLKVNATLVSSEFSNLSYGPFISGSTSMLEEGNEGSADFSLPAEVAPGNYRVLVQASQDSVIKNKVFEKKLLFPLLGGFTFFPLLLALIFVALAIYLFRNGIRKLRNPKVLESSNPNRDRKVSMENDEFDVEAILDNILVENQRRREIAQKKKSGNITKKSRSLPTKKGVTKSISTSKNRVKTSKGKPKSISTSKNRVKTSKGKPKSKLR